MRRGSLNLPAVTVRRMVPEDLDQVAAMEADIFPEPWKRGAFESALQNPDTIYLSAVSDTEILGYCGLYRSFEVADIVNVAVRAACRGQGVGEKMLRTLMAMGREQGIERFTLEVRVGNTAAIRLYEKLGFRSVGRRKDFYSLPREDAQIMWTEDI